MRIGLQKWGIPEMQERTRLMNELEELISRPTTEETVRLLNVVIDGLKNLYGRFTTHDSGKEEEYEVTVTYTIFENMIGKDTQFIMAMSENSAKAAALQNILDRMEVRFLVKKYERPL